MYAKLLRMRDNFITAAINAEDNNMKSIWINRANEVSKQLKFVSRLRIKDVEK